MAVILVTTNDFDANTPIDASDVVVTEDNVQDIDTGLDQGGDDYDSLVIAEGYRKNVGASGSPLRCCATVTRFLSGGNIYFHADDNNDAGGEDMDDVLIRMMESSNQVFISNAAAVTAACDWFRIALDRGTLNIANDLTWGAEAMLNVGWVNSRGGDATLIVPSGGSTIPVLNMAGGTAFVDVAITDACIAGGKLKQDTAAIATLVIGDGGVVEYDTTATLTKVVVQPGGFLNLIAKSVAKTITSCIVQNGGRIAYNEDLTTFTNPLRDYNRVIMTA